MAYFFLKQISESLNMLKDIYRIEQRLVLFILVYKIIYVPSSKLLISEGEKIMRKLDIHKCILHIKESYIYIRSINKYIERVCFLI